MAIGKGKTAAKHTTATKPVDPAAPVASGKVLASQIAPSRPQEPSSVTSNVRTQLALRDVTALNGTFTKHLEAAIAVEEDNERLPAELADDLEKAFPAGKGVNDPRMTGLLSKPRPGTVLKSDLEHWPKTHDTMLVETNADKYVTSNGDKRSYWRDFAENVQSGKCNAIVQDMCKQFTQANYTSSYATVDLPFTIKLNGKDTKSITIKDLEHLNDNGGSGAVEKLASRFAKRDVTAARKIKRAYAIAVAKIELNMVRNVEVEFDREDGEVTRNKKCVNLYITPKGATRATHYAITLGEMLGYKLDKAKDADGFVSKSSLVKSVKRTKTKTPTPATQTVPHVTGMQGLELYFAEAAAFVSKATEEGNFVPLALAYIGTGQNERKDMIRSIYSLLVGLKPIEKHIRERAAAIIADEHRVRETVQMVENDEAQTAA